MTAASQPIRTPKQIAYSPAEAGEQVGLSERAIQTVIADGDLECHYYGRSPRIYHDDLVAWFLSLPTERQAAS